VLQTARQWRLLEEAAQACLALTEPMLELHSGMVKGRLNIVVSGGTGADKTSLLNVLSGYIPTPSVSLPSRMRRNCS